MNKKRDTTRTDAVTITRSEVERLNAQELKFARLHLQRSTELAELRSRRGQQVLKASDPLAVVGAVNTRIRAAEDELAGLAEAAGEAHKARLLAIPAVFLAEAEDRERQAAQLDADADKLEAEVKKLLEPVEKLADWAYLPAEGRVDGRYFRVVPRNDGGPFRVVEAFGPRHERMRSSARALRMQAAETRSAVPHKAGSLEADSLEDLLALVFSEALRLAPPAASIIEVMEEARENELRRRVRLTNSGSVPADLPLRYKLTWRNGSIDVGQSGVFMPEPVDEIEEVFVTSPSAPVERFVPAAEEIA